MEVEELFVREYAPPGFGIKAKPVGKRAQICYQYAPPGFGIKAKLTIWSTLSKISMPPPVLESRQSRWKVRSEK